MGRASIRINQGPDRSSVSGEARLRSMARPRFQSTASSRCWPASCHGSSVICATVRCPGTPCPAARPFIWPCSSIGWTALLPVSTCWLVTLRSWIRSDGRCTSNLRGPHRLAVPTDLPLFLLQEGDVRQLAAEVSCRQDIAGDGAFSLGMIAEFASSLHRYGPWFYRRLFWETGLIGQVLYLEAEADWSPGHRNRLLFR